jgi:DNA polymerase V
VLLMGLQPKGTIQANLFEGPTGHTKSAKLMEVMDTINKRMGKGSLTIAASGTNQRWAMRRERKSPSYTTEWNELPVAG